MPADPIHALTRREWLSASLLSTGALLVGLDNLPDSQSAPAQSQRTGAKLLGTIPFLRESSLPTETLLGEELDGRLYADLSKLIPLETATASPHFYVRTRASHLLDQRKPWSVRLGSNEHAVEISSEELQRQSRPQGLHLMECAGNTREAHFGMLSVADWTGVPIQFLLDRLPAADAASRILISGFDEYATASQTSRPGGSWIFSRPELVSSGAFVATQMNGEPLTADHGAPLRLVVPNWYGCVCIKWLNSISLVDDSAPSTSHMADFAFRTHQTGSPALARDFQPATIDAAAMPIRVEQWTIGNRIQYRVVGIVWGGSQPVKQLEIRFNPDEDFVPVESFHQTANDPWTFWTHTWAPAKRDTYVIRLRVAAPQMRTRRLDMGFYARTVEITEI